MRVKEQGTNKKQQSRGPSVVASTLLSDRVWRLKFVVCSLLFVLCSSAFAAKYAGEFLNIGVGARAVGMGGAVTAYIDDGTSFYWNPAGTSYLAGPQATVMYADLWDGLANYSIAGLALPVSGAVFSVNWVRLGVPDIQQHRDYDQLMQLPDSLRFVEIDGERIYYNSVQEYLLATGANPQGTFSDNESAIFLNFAKLNKFSVDLGWSYFQLPLELPIGANLKIVNQSLGGKTGQGIGGDFGAQLRFKTQDVFWEQWKCTIGYGFNWQDMTRTAVDWGEGNQDAVPSTFRNGVFVTQKLPGKDNDITACLDYEHRWDPVYHWGLEYRMAKTLFLRGGFWGDEWTAGAGLSLWRANVDYAYLSKELGASHRVSLSVKLK